MNIATWDIEANNWKDFLICGAYNGTEYKTHRNIKDYLLYIGESYINRTTIYAHFGGIYDFMFIIHFVFNENSQNIQITDILLMGKKILKLEIRIGKKYFSFVDSSGLFPFSLDKLTTSFDVDHKKQKIDFSKKLVINKKLLSYLESDVIGLYECLIKYSQDEYVKKVGIKLTRSGQSFATFKQFMKEKHGHNILPNVSQHIKDFARQAYFGGRTEIFKPLYINKKKPLNVYDINSLYPSVMVNEYPSKFHSFTLDYHTDMFGIYNCIVKVPESLKFPILPTKIDGKLKFPTGIFEGYFTNIELDKAISLGCEILEIKKGCLFENGGNIFKDFINHFYTLRKNTKDPVKKILYKDYMNHLYGRLAINEVREKFSLTSGEGKRIHSSIDFGSYDIRLYSETDRIFTYSNPVLSCFVTSYARLKLYDYMEKVNFNIYYCDTDSLFTPNKMESSNNLGDMKLEYQLKEACFLLPKTYSGTTITGEMILKMKGFPTKSLNHISFDDFVGCLSGEMRMPSVKISGGLAGLKTAMKKKEILMVLPDSTKQLRAVYDKRIIIKNKKEYDTKPVHVNLQGELF